MSSRQRKGKKGTVPHHHDYGKGSAFTGRLEKRKERSNVSVAVGRGGKKVDLAREIGEKKKTTAAWPAGAQKKKSTGTKRGLSSHWEKRLPASVVIQKERRRGNSFQGGEKSGLV